MIGTAEETPDWPVRLIGSAEEAPSVPFDCFEIKPPETVELRLEFIANFDCDSVDYLEKYRDIKKIRERDAKRTHK